MSLDHYYSSFIKSGVIESINYEKFNLYLLTHHSASIEGSTLTEIETQLLLDEDITPKGKPLEHSLMVKDHYQALNFVISQAKAKRAITADFIKEVAALVNKTTGSVTNTVLGSFDDSKGDYRLSNARAGNEYFMTYDKIAVNVENLCESLNKKIKQVKGFKDIYNLSFDAHYYLVTIHPFGDGNGRASRLLMNYIQACHDQPLCLVFAEDKAAYIEALKASRKKKSLSHIREFMNDQLVKYFKKELDAFQAKSKGISFVF